MAIENIDAGTFSFYSPRFEVEIDGSRLGSRISKSILDVRVEEKLNTGVGFTINISEEYDMKTQTFKWLDHKIFNVGNKIKIKIGYENELVEMIEGKITTLNPSFFAKEAPTITIEGKDLSYDFLKKTSMGKEYEKTFLNMGYSDIVSAIANKAGLTPKVTRTGKRKEPICKKNDVSYFQFITELARRAGGFEFSIGGKTLYFVMPGTEKKELLTLALGKDIIRFSPRLSTARLYSEVEVRGHNLKDPGKPLIGTAKPGSEMSQEGGKMTASQLAKKKHNAPKKVITNANISSVADAKALAKSELNKLSNRLVEGTVECIGIPKIRAGVCIYLDKMGERFSGKYYVTAATHTIDDNGYRTSFTVQRNAL